MTSCDAPDRHDSFRFKNNMCADKRMISLAKPHDPHPRCRACKVKILGSFEFGCDRGKELMLENPKVPERLVAEYGINTLVLDFIHASSTHRNPLYTLKEN